jgi:hypothetical protein
MKTTIFWDITPYSPLKVNRRFGGIYRLHLQGRRISQARNQRESRWKAEPLRPWIRRRYFPPKRRLPFNGLHGVISQKTALFIITSVRTSNSTYILNDYRNWITINNTRKYNAVPVKSMAVPLLIIYLLQLLFELQLLYIVVETIYKPTRKVAFIPTFLSCIFFRTWKSCNGQPPSPTSSRKCVKY